MNLKSHDFLVNLTISQNATHDFGYLGVGRPDLPERHQKLTYKVLKVYNSIILYKHICSYNNAKYVCVVDQ